MSPLLTLGSEVDLSERIGVWLVRHPLQLENFQASDYANYWSIEQSRGWQALPPYGCSRIYGYQIPKSSSSVSALRIGITIARLGHSLAMA